MDKINFAIDPNQYLQLILTVQNQLNSSYLAEMQSLCFHTGQFVNYYFMFHRHIMMK
ncbi:hypothetical protein [Bacillus cereus]|uniref:hypothetical protein n=1 Tax=Bacillus cereus TaxID=1396 RepID=UPI003D9B7037